MKIIEYPNKLKAMMASVITAAVLSASASAAAFTEVTAGRLPQTERGTLKRYTAYSPELKGNFTVDILLPEDYDDDSATRYPVLYMHDGQNLFDASISYAGVAWEVERTIGMLCDRNLIKTPIVVGIHNRGTKRPSDYIPAKPANEYIAETDRDASGMWELVGDVFGGDSYAAFVARTLKAAVDETFRTLPDRDDTFIMGSSMGGLASIYAMCEYPDIYGGAACLSTHWIGNFDPDSRIYPTAMLAYLTECLPSPATHRLYLDRGTVDLDSYYGEWDDRAIAIAKSKGYDIDAGSLYTYVDAGATHNEAYWAARLDRPVHFLLHSTDDPYEPVNPGETEFQAIFKDSRYSWAAPLAFAWGGGVTQLGSWPGTSMTSIEYDGAPAWAITFRHKIAPTNIIFHNGLGVQTKDLVFRNNYVYDFDGPQTPAYSGVESVQVQSAVTVYVAAGVLVIEASRAAAVPLVTPDGRTTLLQAAPGTNRYTHSPGLYIISGKKIVIPR